MFFTYVCSVAPAPAVGAPRQRSSIRRLADIDFTGMDDQVSHSADLPGHAEDVHGSIAGDHGDRSEDP